MEISGIKTAIFIRTTEGEEFLRLPLDSGFAWYEEVKNGWMILKKEHTTLQEACLQQQIKMLDEINQVDFCKGV
jgi:hypothetical protein